MLLPARTISCASAHLVMLLLKEILVQTVTALVHKVVSFKCVEAASAPPYMHLPLGAGDAWCRKGGLQALRH